MKKLFLLLIPITLLTLCGCSDDTISQRVYDLENTQYMILQRIEVIEIDQIDKNIVDTWIAGDDINIRPDNLIYCHQRKDIKLWDNVYFAYLWNRDTDYLKNQEWIKTVRIDWQDWYYDIQPVVEILWEIVEGQNCITIINWYWTEPQKTYQDMIENIKHYIKCSNKWCNE